MRSIRVTIMTMTDEVCTSATIFFPVFCNVKVNFTGTYDLISKLEGAFAIEESLEELRYLFSANSLEKI